jgi:hypothetical protein
MKGLLGIALAITTLAGCATQPQQSLPMNVSAIGQNLGRIGVAMTQLPKVDTQFPGASCLLCMAAASAANSSLTSHANTLPHDDLPKIKNHLADLLKKNGTEVVLIEEPISLDALSDVNPGPNAARKDFSPLHKKHGVDRLLVIDIRALGFIRTYSAYFATSEPKAYMRGIGYIVNSSNAYDWYQPFDATRSADRNWDEPPKFPGLTNAYFQVLELGKDAILRPFVRK